MSASPPESPSPPDATVLVDDVVRRLEQLIVTGTLKPGEKLVEQSLCTQFGISRGPLREAIRTLEARRLVQRKPFAGVRVVSLSVDEIEQLLVTREALEGMAARGAAENMTKREIDALWSTLAAGQQVVASEGIEAAFTAGRQFDLHLQIARGCRNRFLEDMICRDLYPLLGLFRYYSAQFRGGDFADSIAEHTAIISAIERREADDAERQMRAHIARSRQIVLNHLRTKDA
jgi:DNA-binding GntR family transcriptional regulator